MYTQKIMLYETKLPTSNYLNIWRLPPLQMHCSQNKTSQISILKNWRTLFETVGFSSLRQITFKCIILFCQTTGLLWHFSSKWSVTISMKRLNSPLECPKTLKASSACFVAAVYDCYMLPTLNIALVITLLVTQGKRC